MFYFQVCLLVNILIAVSLCENITSRQFIPSYTSCESSFSTEKFSIILPKKATPDITECKFSVLSFASDVCRLRLNFKQFAVPSSPSCRDQFFRAGGRRLCGSILGSQEVPFPYSPLVIQYRGTSEQPLHIEVEQVRCKVQAIGKTCDQISSAPQTEISSPNYPNTYPTPLTCVYTIKNNPNHQTCQLLFKFLDFDLPDSSGCLKGRLLIDGKVFCGKKTGWTVSVNVTEDFRFEFSAGSTEASGGFRVAVDQIPCERANRLPGNESASQLGYLPPISSFPVQCCNRVFDTTFFVITSPGFLQLNPSTDYSCVYQIIRSSPSVCRLRFIFRHFWLGQEDYYYGCTDGFLEIDGQRFCGCKDGLVLDRPFVGERKDLLFNMRGVKGKGFVVEVKQEDCIGIRGRNLPDYTTENPDNEVEILRVNSTIEKVRSRFLIPSDASRCRDWGLPNWVEKVKTLIESWGQCPAPPPLISLPQPPIKPPCDHAPFPPPAYPQPVPPILPPTYPQAVPPILPPTYPQPVPPILPPTYPQPTPPIRPPQYPQPAPPIAPPVQPPQYPQPAPPIAPPVRPPLPPVYPNPLPPVAPRPLIYPPYPPSYPPVTPAPPIIQFPPQYPGQPFPSRCQVSSSLFGSFQSPGYPWNYPPNLKCCYRFLQRPGFCRLQVIILDFDIAWSPKCWKDYLLYNNRYRYCGRALQSTSTYLPFWNGFASVDLVTDGFISSRGFRAVYRQIPCGSQLLPRSDQTPATPAPPLTSFTTRDYFELNVTAV